MAGRDSGRNPRLRLACSRCQRRKIRCDAQLPTCGNCRKVGGKCTDGESLRLRSVIDNGDGEVISRLRRRVEWLESIIAARLPDVDLTAGTAFGGAEPHQDTAHPFARGSEPGVSIDDTTTSVPQSALPPQAATVPDQRAHEIGLIAVGVNTDQRYLGPSSGYFLARLLLSCSPRQHESGGLVDHNATNLAQPFINRLVEAAPGPLPLPGRTQAIELARIYFDTIHPQYPILHEPSFKQSLERLYQLNDDTLENDAIASFQVNMVLAIASSILSSRARSYIPGESYCLSALQHLESLNVQNSFVGLQCILLLLVFTMHSPHMRLNVWYLNYHCIAAVVDLGLQRDITTSSGISLLEQEMRTRVFWTVFALDRTIGTMMGRPIGLRDEACELRLPQDLDDDALVGALDPESTSTGRMKISIHLFKLAKINSEIKYVANSIVGRTPSYTHPPVADIHTWHRGMLEKVDQWASRIPQTDNRHAYVRALCELRYYSIKILLLRPSPAIPRPSKESLVECYGLAWQAIHVYDRLYRQDTLVHDWLILHGIVFNTTTALYCIRAVPDLARNTELDDLMSNLSLSLSLVSVAGERWSGAKRSRQILDDIGRSTVKWMKALKTTNETSFEEGAAEYGRIRFPLASNTSESIPPIEATFGGSFTELTPNIATQSARPSTPSPEEGVWTDTTLQFGFGDIPNVDDIMHSLFEDFIPMDNTQY